MTLSVNTSMTALNGRYYVQQISDQIAASVERMTTGTRLNSARDDAASLKLADLFDTQLIGLNQANRNANRGLAMAQIAEGSLSEINNNLQRAYQLTVMGGNRSLAANDRNALGEELTVLLKTNNTIANNTFYGQTAILNYDSDEEGFLIQARPEPASPDVVKTGNAILTALFGSALNSAGITGQTLSAISANLAATGDMGRLVAAYMLVANQSDAGAAADALFTGTREGNISQLANNSAVQIDLSAFARVLTDQVAAQVGQSGVIAGAAGAFTAFADTDVAAGLGYSDEQINQINAFTTDVLLDVMTAVSTEVTHQRARLGADQNGLQSTIRANSQAMINVKNARSRIADTDYAAEAASLTRNRILLDGANSVLAMSGQSQSLALALIR